MALIAFIALSASVTPLVGQNWGAGKLKRVNQSFYWSVIFCLIWGISEIIKKSNKSIIQLLHQHESTNLFTTSP
ncbi:MATE family efflux transporter [Stanieria cyanosphaera]|uniref:MATE family efflux transporter n=1 Tax=Stanieria cyanosphaera TaxID=102116 RepID=UPI003899E822